MGSGATGPVALRWWDTAAPVELKLACGQAEHHLQWHRGEVVMLDHPEAEAEVALVALGGEEPACLSMLRLWELAVADGGFLEEWVDDAHLSVARLSWLSMALDRLRSEGFHEFLRSIPTDRAEPMGRFVHRFPRPWLDRAAAAVAETIIDGDGVICANAPGLLRLAAAQRVRRAFVASVGESGVAGLSLGAAALVPLSVTVGSNEADCAAIAGTVTGSERSMSIAVDERWLHQVWAAGAAVVDGRLVLALGGTNSDHDTAAFATVVEWRDGSPILTTRMAGFDDGRWSLRD